MNDRYRVAPSLPKKHYRFAVSAFLSIIFLLVLVMGVFAARNFLWQDQFGSDGRYDSAYGVAAQDDKVFVSGWLETENYEVDWVIRAYDANNGNTIWQDNLLTNTIPPAEGIAVDDNRVFAVGSRQITYGNNDWVVRAYDTDTGLLLWQDEHDFAGKNDSARAVVVRNGQLFVAGSTLIETGDFDWVVRAYNPIDGTLLWQDQFDLDGDRESPYKIAVQGNKLFVAGSVQYSSSTSDQDWLIRVYDTDTGLLLWQDLVDLSDGYDFLNDMVVSRTQLITVGSVLNEDGNYDWLVRANDIADGSLQWQDQIDNDGGSDLASAVAAQGHQVYVAGAIANSQGSFGRDAVLRVYNKNGSLLWEDSFDLGGSFNTYEQIAIQRGQIIVAGEAIDNGGNAGWLVRSFNSRRRALLWQDYKVGGFQDFVIDMAVNNNQVFIVGDGTDAFDVQDWLVRAYSLSR